uniref:Charged multivesicular body protein 4b n=1 Tax=Castor canadensis TaxID=51338 RepID=A0A8C0WB73_CASCN
MTQLGTCVGRGRRSTQPRPAVAGSRDTEEMLSKKQEFQEEKIEQELTAARKPSTKHKCAALRALKPRRAMGKQLAQIDGTLSTTEFQREALEDANTNTQGLENMGSAARAMKAAHDNMAIDQVDELMRDIAGFGEEFDEDELMAELEELEREELDRNLLEISGPETVPLPNVPSIALPSKPAKKKEEEDDAMKELENWAGSMSLGQCQLGPDRLWWPAWRAAIAWQGRQDAGQVASIAHL